MNSSIQAIMTSIKMSNMAIDLAIIMDIININMDIDIDKLSYLSYSLR